MHINTSHVRCLYNARALSNLKNMALTILGETKHSRVIPLAITLSQRWAVMMKLSWTKGTNKE